MTFPSSPAECHAPFNGPGKKHWMSSVTLKDTISDLKAKGVDGVELSKMSEIFLFIYAAAQEAEYNHLLLMALGEAAYVNKIVSNTFSREADYREAQAMLQQTERYYLAHTTHEQAR